MMPAGFAARVVWRQLGAGAEAYDLPLASLEPVAIEIGDRATRQAAGLEPFDLIVGDRLARQKRIDVGLRNAGFRRDSLALGLQSVHPNLHPEGLKTSEPG